MLRAWRVWRMRGGKKKKRGRLRCSLFQAAREAASIKKGGRFVESLFTRLLFLLNGGMYAREGGGERKGRNALLAWLARPAVARKEKSVEKKGRKRTPPVFAGRSGRDCGLTNGFRERRKGEEGKERGEIDRKPIGLNTGAGEGTGGKGWKRGPSRLPPIASTGQEMSKGKEKKGPSCKGSISSWHWQKAKKKGDRLRGLRIASVYWLAPYSP